jgi:hypothetical protein
MRKLQVTVWNNYTLNVNYDDKNHLNNKRVIMVDLDNKQQLYNIIKRKKEFKFWQPDSDTRAQLLRALNEQ